MKNSASRILSMVLFAACWVCTGAAQQQTPPTTPPATPPDQEQPAPRSNIRQPPPPLPKVPDIRQPGETGYWLSVTAWFPRQAPTFDKGRGATFTDATRTRMEGKPKYGEGFEMGFAVGLHNALRLTYWEDRASGNVTNATDLRIWNQTYPAGNVLSTDYRIQHARISFDYLSWPYPVEKRRFRFKTLWGVQYTGVRTSFNLPLKPLIDASGNPILDANGNPVNYGTQGSHWFITPAIGIGIAQYIAGKVRFEANATGFTIPRHTTYWDADGSLNIRSGHFELRLGGKAFHYKTSTQAEFFMHGTQYAPFVGIRWYSDSY